MKSSNEVLEDDTLSLTEINMVCLNDNYIHPVIFEEITYPSLRHVLVSLKTEDPNLKLKISKTMFPADLKELEQSIPTPFYWDKEYIINFLSKLTSKKFRESTKLRNILILTDPKILRPKNSPYQIEEIKDEDYGLILMEERKNYVKQKALL